MDTHAGARRFARRRCTATGDAGHGGRSSRDAVKNPGFPPHRPRVTDLDPKKDKSAERSVYTLFYLSIVGSVFALAAYMVFPIVPATSARSA